jgi:transcriptional regulator with XRE-family HTH domain
MEVDGQKLRRARYLQAYSLSDLEERSGVNKSTILAIEQGKRKRAPHPGTIRKLAQALGVEPRELLKDSPHEDV